MPVQPSVHALSQVRRNATFTGRLAMLLESFLTPFDVTDQFPDGWQEDLHAIAAEAEFRDFPRTPFLSREAADVTHVTRGRVHAVQVQQKLPWLYKLYRDQFLELASRAWREPIDPAVDDRYGVVLNVQRGNRMRFECHVDSNPVTGLMFFDGKTYPHYARPLVSESDVRVVAVMHFYTVSSPESTRPRELNRHLF